MFSQWNSSWSMGQFFGSAVTHNYLTKNLRSCPWVVYLTFSLGYGYPQPLFVQNGYDYVKRFVRVLVLIQGLQKIAKKIGNTTLLISSSNYAKRHINVCSGGHLCSPF